MADISNETTSAVLESKSVDCSSPGTVEFEPLMVTPNTWLDEMMIEDRAREETALRIVAGIGVPKEFYEPPVTWDESLQSDVNVLQQISKPYLTEEEITRRHDALLAPVPPETLSSLVRMWWVRIVRALEDKLLAAMNDIERKNLQIANISSTIDGFMVENEELKAQLEDKELDIDSLQAKVEQFRALGKQIAWTSKSVDAPSVPVLKGRWKAMVDKVNAQGWELYQVTDKLGAIFDHPDAVLAIRNALETNARMSSEFFGLKDWLAGQPSDAWKEYLHCDEAGRETDTPEAIAEVTAGLAL